MSAICFNTVCPSGTVFGIEQAFPITPAAKNNAMITEILPITVGVEKDNQSL